MELSGTGVWSHHLRWGDAAEAAEAAAELEELGYSALWIPDVGGPVLEAVDRLAAATERVTVATGILNLWMHEPDEVAAGYGELVDAHGDRILIGIGVSHAPLIDAQEPGRFRRPLAAMSRFLDGLDAAKRPLPAASRVLAALGPKMLALATERSGGIHPYLVTPEHTHLARQAVGPDRLVLPEQTVLLAASRDEARQVGEEWLRHYLGLPNYANSLKRLGFSEDDISTVSDRLFDDVIAWGDESAIKTRLDDHRAAGADHVCIQVLVADQQRLPRQEWRRLAPALI